jgi:iron-sulfur cluster repair protein YtfE (RIC family)
MTKHERFSSVLTLALADHELIAACMENCRGILAGGHLDDLMSEEESLQSLVGTKLATHFQMEETILFPFLLEGSPSDEVRQLIVTLTVEHRLILDKARDLRQTAARTEPGNDYAFLLRKLTLDFLDSLQAHAAKEDALLLALLDKQRQNLSSQQL